MSAPIRIVTYDRLSDLWDGALEGWFEARQEAGLPKPGAAPAIVLAPDVAHLGWLKRRWLEQGGGPLMGIRFWTPGQLRHFLLDHFFPNLRLATAEDLTLALQLELAEEPPDSPLGVVAQQPAGFLSAWDAWLAARGERHLFAAPWQDLPGRLARRLQLLGLISVREVDARLAELKRGAEPVLGPLLVDGFSGLQASLFGLLQATLAQAESGLLTTPLPRDRRLEQAWVGSFEMACSANADLITGGYPEPSSFGLWSERAEQGLVTADLPEGAGFRLFQTRQDEVSAIVAQVSKWCASASEGSIGVVLPSDPFLVRGVSEGLIQSGIPIHDTFGFFPAAGASERLFAAWVEFQRTGQLVQADAFLDVLVDTRRYQSDDAGKIRRAWRWARERTLSDDLGVLCEYLKKDTDAAPNGPIALAWSRQWIRLPESRSIADFLDLCVPIVATWKGEREFAQSRLGWAKTWEGMTEPIDRTLFLEWMWGSLRRPGRARHPSARDAFAPVQIISYEMVRSARWSHLLLAGLNERLVPTLSPEGAFLSPDAAARHLAQCLVEGPQGSGQEALCAHAGFLLDDNDRRALLSDALFDAIADTSEAVALFATYAPEGDDRTATVLSEIYQRLFRAACGADAPLPVTEVFLRSSVVASGTVPLPPEQTLSAYTHRFDPTTPFDAYSFGWEKAPSEPIELAVRDWEAVLQRPASVWLSAVARVRPREDFAEPIALPLLRGAAVHDLLRPLGPTAWFSLQDNSENGEWEDALTKRSACWRDSAEWAHTVSGKSLSPLWLEQWGHTQSIARRLIKLVQLNAVLPWLGSEWKLPKGSRWIAPDGEALHLRGRVDALLVDDPEHPASALVIDFKTGGDTALRRDDLSKGKGLQLVLYGGTLADLFQCEVSLCLLKSDDHDLLTQLTIAPGEDPSGLLPGLIALGKRGVFGFVGEVRSEYAFVGDYPMALVPPPSEIAEVKWARTHPLLSREEGGAS